MGLGADIAARVRGKIDPQLDFSSGASGSLTVNPHGDLAISQSLPERAELVRMGWSFFAIATSAVAPIIAMPSTTAQLSLYNGELDTGRVYVIDSVGLICVASAAAATSLGVLACMGIGKKAVLSSALTPKGLSGVRYKGSAILAIAAAVTNDTWHILGDHDVGPTSQVGLTVDINVFGKYIVPPGHYFSMAVAANTVTTITVRQFIRWHEVQLPIG